MVYKRIEAISKSLGDTRINIRLCSAIENLEIRGIYKDTSSSLTTLALILENPDDLADRNKESNDLLQALLSIVRETVIDSSRSNSLNISTKILEKLYFLKETETETVVGTAKTAADEAS